MHGDWCASDGRGTVALRTSANGGFMRKTNVNNSLQDAYGTLRGIGGVRKTRPSQEKLGDRSQGVPHAPRFCKLRAPAENHRKLRCNRAHFSAGGPVQHHFPTATARNVAFSSAYTIGIHCRPLSNRLLPHLRPNRVITVHIKP